MIGGVLALSGGFLSQPVYAQTVSKPVINSTADAEYQYLARAAETMPERFNFMKFRSYYAHATHYDPVGEETLRIMRDLAYTALHDADQVTADLALEDYRILVNQHLAHLGVVGQALIFARQDRRFGDAKFFQWLKTGLIQSVVISGNGRSLREAYDVITAAEETALLGTLGFKVLDTRAAHEGYYYYNFHEVEEVASGRRTSIFVNTTLPMQYLARQKKEEQGVTLDIGRQ